MNTPSAILVGIADKTVHVRVEGKGSYLNSTGLKEFAKEMINRGFREFRVDMRSCPVVDSTFMGTLAGIALRLKELGSGELRAVHLNERNFDLLTNLGLDQLFRLFRDDDSEGGGAVQVVEPLPCGPVDKTTRAKTMLEAHENIVEANPENAVKFKDVLDFLKHDLRDGD